MAGFKLTYATMYNPPEELHANFDSSLAKLKTNLGKEHAMIINGKDVFAEEKFEDRTPIDTDRHWPLRGKLSQGGAIRPGRSASSCFVKPPT
jgi:hypothetical protein